MSKNQAAVRTIEALKPALIHLQDAEANAARAIRQAQELHREIQEVLRIAQHQHLLVTLEMGRLESLENAEAYPEHRDYYIAEAERRRLAHAILSAPMDTLGATV